MGPLKPGVVYDDVNGDQTVESVTTHIEVNHEVIGEHGARHMWCNGIIESGLPGAYHEKVWNGSICLRGGFLQQFEMLKTVLRQGEHHTDATEDSDPSGLNFADWGASDHADEYTTAAPPVVLHRRAHEAHGLHKMRSSILFYINSGLVTAVDPQHGGIQWQVETDATFHAGDDADEVEDPIDGLGSLSLRGYTQHNKHALAVHPFPHLVPFSLPATHASHKHSHKVHAERSVATIKDKPFVFVVGDNVLSMLKTDSGRLEDEYELPDTVTAPLVIGDFNGDGTNDVIFVTRSGYYGMEARQRGGGSVLTFLLLSVISVLGLLFVTRHMVQVSDPYYEPRLASKRATD
eukprot:NODE_1840_length_1200_cov_66.342964_g1824_i0.p1 GENE.NODE_1840_length_1200_cov_66.342964_g1824_i0~~NODE_1840_length_1200_cov_66.342964_g1824_i0.p1  ORF type:complete len:373 (-),score=83.14 NODE_1840_length_1200_cov_66.342964_g1824_i0:82-1125(-)